MNTLLTPTLYCSVFASHETRLGFVPVPKTLSVSTSDLILKHYLVVRPFKTNPFFYTKIAYAEVKSSFLKFPVGRALAFFLSVGESTQEFFYS
jgi:hypothetical protein